MYVNSEFFVSEVRWSRRCRASQRARRKGESLLPRGTRDFDGSRRLARLASPSATKGSARAAPVRHVRPVARRGRPPRPRPLPDAAGSTDVRSSLGLRSRPAAGPACRTSRQTLPTTRRGTLTTTTRRPGRVARPRVEPRRREGRVEGRAAADAEAARRPRRRRLRRPGSRGKEAGEAEGGAEALLFTSSDDRPAPSAGGASGGGLATERAGGRRRRRRATSR